MDAMNTMNDTSLYLLALGAGLGITLTLAAATWVVSYFKTDVSIVDAMWSLLILGAGLAYAAVLPVAGPRADWVLALAVVWALRLSGYIAWRNHGEPEDRRYQEIRARNQPHFEWKSFYLVFVLQAVLAWIVSMSLLAAVAGIMTWITLHELLPSAFLHAGKEGTIASVSQNGDFHHPPGRDNHCRFQIRLQRA